MLSQWDHFTIDGDASKGCKTWAVVLQDDRSYSQTMMEQVGFEVPVSIDLSDDGSFVSFKVQLPNFCGNNHKEMCLFWISLNKEDLFEWF